MKNAQFTSNKTIHEKHAIYFYLSNPHLKKIWMNKKDLANLQVIAMKRTMDIINADIFDPAEEQYELEQEGRECFFLYFYNFCLFVLENLFKIITSI